MVRSKVLLLESADLRRGLACFRRGPALPLAVEWSSEPPPFMPLAPWVMETGLDWELDPGAELGELLVLMWGGGCFDISVLPPLLEEGPASPG